MKLEMKYFILKPKAKSCNDIYAKASQAAMKAYADIVRPTQPEFASELDKWVEEEKQEQEKRKHT